MTERLARFSPVTVDDPRLFGGGARCAEVRYRGETVTYGYLAVVEELADPGTGLAWSTLAVTLPPASAAFTIDHRTALGRAGVPVAGPVAAPSGDRLFDRSYVVVADEAGAGLVGPGLRAAVLQRPAQRLSLGGSTLLVRTFDGVRATDETVEWLEQLAESVLRETPAFTTSLGTRGTYPAGLYGPNGHSSGRRRHRLAGMFRRGA